ncbi:DUF2851 family protein [Terrimonas sp. NA20]|uniref:DUF2851 family protein n=1 Tax=Terrimonas ginsenosidimutans TaxID=2908004 RepID=A0ABS9KRQ8_9BACT|nr:DUF2851 family protein [Terrimonas ginsenosidimutans]MCG2615022.1 DUF2851 family protein [Terrimonas ginsenosidimutans]
MTERLLQYIWQVQYYNASGLMTIDGENVLVFAAGTHNTNQGPDFLNARIRIGDFTWSGSVELHLRTSDWQRHEHEQDPLYNNVILHVVWDHDAFVNDLPVLELKDRISGLLLQQYEFLLNATGFIPCGKQIMQIKEIEWQRWKDRLVAERMLRKAEQADVLLKQNNYHWAETFWWLLARSFGSQVNADFFESVARSIPLSLLSRHKNQIHQLEALLLGQAGLLNACMGEDYPVLLQREYGFLRHKYSLDPVHGQALFLRMRPVNFPTVRLAQLAMLIHQTTHLFSKVKEAEELKEIFQWLEVTANDYWHYHYRLGEVSAFKPKKIGAGMIESIVINTIVPLLFAYAHFHGEEVLKAKALRWLMQLSAESNTVIDGFMELGVGTFNAFDSQAMLELKSQYCNQRRCLDCAAGNVILQRGEKEEKEEKEE